MTVPISKALQKEMTQASKKTDPFLSLRDSFLRWAQKKSLTLFVVNAQSCCTGHIKDLKVGQPNQVGGIISRNPSRANVLIICGAVSHQMGPVIRSLYDQMEKPSWVIALGSCAAGGGVYHHSYGVVKDLGQIVPVDIFIPGCPVSHKGLVEALDKIIGSVV
ncbi:MAG: NADH-quinone oxidoreductase subunit B [Alphaproteobacteria bacterium]